MSVPSAYFGKWLREKMESESINAYSLAEDIGITPTSIYDHLHNIHVPNKTTLQLYSGYFNDDYNRLYDLAIKDSFSVLESITPIGIFGEWLFNRVKECGLPVSEVAKRLKVSRATLYNHIEERSRPSFDTIKRYCLFFGWNDYFDVYEMALEDWRR